MNDVTEKKELQELIHQFMEYKDYNERELFYSMEILPLIRRKFREQESRKIKAEYDALILSVGNSYLPLVFSIEAIKPKKIYFLYTRETETQIDKIFELMDLKPSQIHKEEVDRINPSYIYEAIKKISRKVGNGHIAIDFTGGTKSMAAGMAMAGGMIGADLIYISSKWNNDMKRVQPGTESLETLKNPYDLFGEIELKRAQKLWKQGEYLAAADVLEQISMQLPDHFEYTVLSKLALAYSSWEALELQDVLENFEWILDKGKENLIRMRSNIISAEDFATLEVQLETVQMLVKHLGKKSLTLSSLQDDLFMKKLILYFYSIALKREEQKKYDLSALYLYRIIEMIFQHRIALRGMLTDKPDYRSLEMDETALIENVNRILKTAKINSTWTEMPGQLALISGHLLLYALGDSVAKKIHPSKLRNATESRNYSILAHGYLNIDDDIFSRIKDVTSALIQGLFQDDEPIEGLLKEYRVVIPASFL